MSTPILPHYSFLPWTRRGNATLIGETDDLGSSTGTALERAQVTLNVKLNGNGSLYATETANLNIIGPGDIIGINTSVVVKTEPHNWITNFEPNYFAHIDFYDEDFPWRFTPAKASGDKLRPWLVLVVLKDDEFTRNTQLSDVPLASININGTAPSGFPLPKHDETWAWAHVHVNDDIDPTNGGNMSTVMQNLNSRLQENPDIAISRIICPRKLEPNTSYNAFLLPAFETGRLIGLGVDPSNLTSIKAQTPSWGVAASHAIQPGDFPVYYEWYFRTGATGDFEYLVRQLKPRTIDNRVGRRPMDIQDPGFGLTYTDGTAPNKGTLALEGALRIPNNDGEPYPWLNSSAFINQLRDLVNLGEDMTYTTLGSSGNLYASTPIAGYTLDDDPIVAPPLYGRWHALKRKVVANDTGWINELNLDPRHRVAAALGGDFVRKNQDLLMDMAWEQVGAVIEANKKIRWAQLAVESSHSMHAKHLKSQPSDQAMNMTAKVQGKVKSGATTLLQKNLQSKLPEVANAAIFRKLRRPDGPIMQRIDPGQTSFVSGISPMATGTLTGAAAKQAPASITLKVDTNSMNLTMTQSLGLNANGYNFKITAPGDTGTGINDAEAIGFQTALQEFGDVYKPVNWTVPAALPPLNVSSAALTAVDALNPLVSMPKRFYKAIEFKKDGVVISPPVPDRIVPAMAAPSFRQPLYRSLRDLGADFFIPNLNLVPPNTISLLETNQKFIEAFMVGANYEMGRELLWREYPTDQRGTYFKHFWENTDLVNTSGLTEKQFEEKVQDIGNIHEWVSTTTLGSHNARLAGGDEAKLVLIIRGDLLKKFPNAVIFAVKAKWQLDGSGEPDKTVHRLMDPGTEIYPVFGAKIEPDITFIGFDLDSKAATGDLNEDGDNDDAGDTAGYFFVIMERPGEPRFGMDISGAGSPATWNDLAFDDVTLTTPGYVDLSAAVTPGDLDIPPSSSNPVTWASNAANMAMILYQNPVLVAIHAKEMLPAI
jgi:hypothetical protein